MSPHRWRALMARLAVPESRDVLDELTAAYAQTHRHYHTAAHVVDCLDRLDEAAGLARSAEEVEIALWFHDAVYAPRSTSNERDSAEWARAFLRATGAPGARCDRVHAHIMATRHDAVPEDPDAALVVDVDLSILGSAPEAYARFERDVRREYAWVPRPLFRRRRRAILEGFLARSSIYSTAHFRERYEAIARHNLAGAIRALA